jgi:hypothetical protein
MLAAQARSRTPQRLRSPEGNGPQLLNRPELPSDQQGQYQLSLPMRLIDVGNRSLTEPVQYPQ